MVHFLFSTAQLILERKIKIMQKEEKCTGCIRNLFRSKRLQASETSPQATVQPGANGGDNVCLNES